MLDVLRHGDLATTNAHLGAVVASLAKKAGRFTPQGAEPYEIVLTFANSLWPQAKYPIEQPFLEAMARRYGAPVHTVDYGQPEAARRAINGWVSEETDSRIPELIPEGLWMTRRVWCS
ncbi:hypothetical protein GCM10009811_10520 [Nostocoides veronense]|uniref:Serpin domain-containing protein n=2 Tax=Nostocoides veronense TaxID=330836 RepID=A0ABP4XR77_9MICO